MPQCKSEDDPRFAISGERVKRLKDTVIFMSAYQTIKLSKSWRPSKKREDTAEVFERHHIAYMMSHDKILTPKGSISLNVEYDYVTQKSTYNYIPVKKEHKLEEFDSYLSSIGFCIKLLHSQSVLADSYYFQIDYFVGLKSFIVYIDDMVFQIDPMVFSMNDTLFVVFEMINFATGIPLERNDVMGKNGNYNLRHINGYSEFGNLSTTLSDFTIPELIYNKVTTFLANLMRKRLFPDEYSFLHNTLILSNRVKNPKKYLLKMIGTKELLAPLVNISTTNNYKYYIQDGISVVTKYKSDDIDIALYNAIMLESIKMYVYLFQIVNVETTKDLNTVTRNDLYLRNLFYSPKVPIETHNLLDYIYSTKTFQNNKEAIQLKLAYMTAKNEKKRNQNSTILNILLYIISLLGALGSLEVLENKLAIPFKYSFIVVIVAFCLLGLVWGINEYHNNKPL